MGGELLKLHKSRRTPACSQKEAHKPEEASTDECSRVYSDKCLILIFATIAAYTAQFCSPRATFGCAFGANFTVEAVHRPLYARIRPAVGIIVAKVCGSGMQHRACCCLHCQPDDLAVHVCGMMRHMQCQYSLLLGAAPVGMLCRITAGRSRYK
jgi:hypothetical protein